MDVLQSPTPGLVDTILKAGAVALLEQQLPLAMESPFRSLPEIAEASSDARVAEIAGGHEAPIGAPRSTSYSRPSLATMASREAGQAPTARSSVSGRRSLPPLPAAAGGGIATMPTPGLSAADSASAPVFVLRPSTRSRAGAAATSGASRQVGLGHESAAESSLQTVARFETAPGAEPGAAPPLSAGAPVTQPSAAASAAVESRAAKFEPQSDLAAALEELDRLATGVLNSALVGRVNNAAIAPAASVRAADLAARQASSPKPPAFASAMPTTGAIYPGFTRPPTPLAAPVAHAPMGSPQPAASTAAPPAEPAALDADRLTELIARALAEQARRHGVDLS
jgi:hypothetical protein